MKTRITQLFELQHPILNAGMGRIALPKLAAAVSNAGGLGVYGAGSNPPDMARAHIRELRALTSKPFGANAPLALPNAMENAKVMLDEQVPVIVYSMGRGDWIAKRAHEYGGKVIAAVNSVTLAKKAQDQGADAVIVTGHEAAGHAGDVTSFVLIPRVAEVVQIPIIASGGIGNGVTIAGALMLGADGVSMGTRFWNTQEAPIHANFKDKAVALDIDGSLFSDRFDGIPCRVMDTPAAERMLTSRLNLFKVFLQSFAIAKEMKTPYLKLLLQVLSLGPEKTEIMIRMARLFKMMDVTFATGSGDIQEGIIAAGQSVGLVHDTPLVAELMAQLVAEAEAAQARCSAKMAA